MMFHSKSIWFVSLLAKQNKPKPQRQTLSKWIWKYFRTARQTHWSLPKASTPNSSKFCLSWRKSNSLPRASTKRTSLRTPCTKTIRNLFKNARAPIYNKNYISFGAGFSKLGHGLKRLTKSRILFLQKCALRFGPTSPSQILDRTSFKTYWPRKFEKNFIKKRHSVFSECMVSEFLAWVI